MSGVPVKIAENYKPPKKLALTQSVSQRLSTGSSATTQVLERSTYDFGLEQTVVAKMNEWQRVRQRENCDRKERLRLHQQERQSVLDAKQKQMLTAVSYPSTDELSSDDDGDDSGHGTSSDASKSAVNMKEQSQKRAQLQQQQQQQQQFSPPSCFNNILVPTVMPGQEKGNPFQSNVGGAVKSPHYSKFNFHEFENDTSSPFDNVELKTMNDLDILAEVWNTSVAINNADSSSKDNTPTGDDDSISTTNTSNVKANKAVQLPNQSYGNQHSSPFPGGAANMRSVQTNHMPMNHSDAAAAAAVSPIPIANHFYGNQIHYNHQTDPNQSYHSMANTQPTYMNTTPLNNNNSPSYVIGQQYVPNRYTTVSPTYDNQAAAAAMALPNHNNGAIAAAKAANTATTNSMYGDKTVITTNSIQAKSKWKSVPDIMQEINTKLRNSEGRRVRNTSECKMNLNRTLICVASVKILEYRYRFSFFFCFFSHDR